MVKCPKCGSPKVTLLQLDDNYYPIPVKDDVCGMDNPDELDRRVYHCRDCNAIGVYKQENI